MNAVERFFRRYIFSTIGIIALFFAVNLLLVGMFFIIAYLKVSQIPISQSKIFPTILLLRTEN